jgi:hypothetical protein
MDINKFSSEFFKFDPNPMTEQQSKSMISLFFLEKENKVPDEVKSTFEYRVTKSRAEYLGLEITDAAALMLAILCQSPGEIVMYLVAIRSKTKSFNMEDLSNIFPMGFPSHIYLGKMWDKQKIKTGNFVDTVSASSFN